MRGNEETGETEKNKRRDKYRQQTFGEALEKMKKHNKKKREEAQDEYNDKQANKQSKEQEEIMFISTDIRYRTKQEPGTE